MHTDPITHLDHLTLKVNDHLKEHSMIHSQPALETIDLFLDWNALIPLLEQAVSCYEPERRPVSLWVIVKCFILQTIDGLSDRRLEEEIADPSGHPSKVPSGAPSNAGQADRLPLFSDFSRSIQWRGHSR